MSKPTHSQSGIGFTLVKYPGSGCFAMGSSKTGRRHHYEAHQRKADTRKIVGRITYNPVKHKQHKVRTLRRKLQEKNILAQLKLRENNSVSLVIFFLRRAHLNPSM